MKQQQRCHRRSQHQFPKVASASCIPHRSGAGSRCFARISHDYRLCMCPVRSDHPSSLGSTDSVRAVMLSCMHFVPQNRLRLTGTKARIVSHVLRSGGVCYCAADLPQPSLCRRQQFCQCALVMHFQFLVNAGDLRSDGVRGGSHLERNLLVAQSLLQAVGNDSFRWSQRVQN